MRKLLYTIIFLFPSMAWGQFSIQGRYGKLPSAGGQALTEVEIARHTNLARCLCDQWSEENDPYSYYFGMRYSGTFNGSDVYFYIGNDCGNTAVPLANCSEIGSLNINSFQNTIQYIPVPVNHLVDPGTGVCKAQQSSSTFYIFSNLENRTISFNLSVAYDTKAPAAPTGVKVTGGENSLLVSWDGGAVAEDGIEFFNVLCSMEGEPASVSGEERSDWVDSEDVCGRVLSLGQDEEGEECPSGALISGNRPHKCYVCGSVPRTANSVRVTGLENGVEYRVAVVAVDGHRNPSLLSEVVPGIPVPTTDFAEHYRDNGGQATGDYCFIATAVYGDRDHPVVKGLRGFRDVALLSHAPGRSFVRWYYRNGPAWANMVEGRPVVRAIMQLLLPLLGLMVLLSLSMPIWFPLWMVRRNIRRARDTEVRHV